MCKNAGILAGWDFAAKRVLMTRSDCNTWECPECNKKMRERWVLRAKMGVHRYIADGYRVDFVTITSHESLKTFSQCDYVFRQAWGKLYDALKRQARMLEYFLVPEKHKDGRMHVHALWTAEVSQKWVKDNARKRGLGHQCKVVKVEDAFKAANYVSKYVGKDIGEDVPRGFRRVRTSQNWIDIPEPNTEQSTLKWDYIKNQAELDGLMRHCYNADYDLIDAKTGKFWDYEEV